MKPTIDYTLYLVLDPNVCGGRNPLDIAEAAIQGGVSLIQLRSSFSTKRAFFELAVALKKRLAPYAVPLIINNEVDIALAARADGVHIGQSDLPPLETRALLGPEAILGLSITARDEMQAASRLPRGTLDYVGIGPAFPTNSKQNAAPALGVEGVCSLLAHSPYPAVTIGGIDAARATLFAPTPLAGIAVISAICLDPNPENASRTLRAAFRPSAQ